MLRSFFIFPITICRTGKSHWHTKFERNANGQKQRRCAIILSWDKIISCDTQNRNEVMRMSKKAKSEVADNSADTVMDGVLSENQG